MASLKDYLAATASEPRQPSLSDDHVRIKNDDLKVLDRVTITRAERIINTKAPEGEDPVFWQCACKEVPGAYFYASSILKDKLEKMLETAGTNEQLNTDLESFGGIPFKMSEQTSGQGRRYIAWDPIED